MSTSTPETALRRCLDAYDQTCARDDARNDFTPESLDRVNLAWRRAMPILTSDPDAIDAFVACVTHGMILKVFALAEASKLLYAAQVAITSRRARLEAARQQSKSEHKSQQPELQPGTKPAPTPSPVAQTGGEAAVGAGEGADAAPQVPATLPLRPSATTPPSPSLAKPASKTAIPDPLFLKHPPQTPPPPFHPGKKGAEGAVAAPQVPRAS